MKLLKMAIHPWTACRVFFITLLKKALVRHEGYGFWSVSFETHRFDADEMTKHNP